MTSKKVCGEVEETSKKASEITVLPAVKEWVQTGCTILDFAVANLFPGGIPVGRIVQIYGGTSTCKSVLAAAILGYAQRKEMKTYYGDIEHTFDPVFAEMYGLTFNSLSNISDFENETFPETIEEFFDDWLSKIIFRDEKKKKLNKNPKVIVTDTITALPAKIEQEKKMDDQGYGAYRARQLSLGYRIYIKSLAESNTTLVVIDQTRDNISSPFGGETVTGGRAPEYYPSVRVYLKHDSKIVNKAKRVIGIWTKFIVKKNKVAPPFREGRFKILFNYGLDDIASNLYFLSEVQNGPQAAKNKSTKIKFLGQEMKMSSAIGYIEDNNLEEDLKKEVWEIWQKIYETEERKPRKW